MEWRPLEGFSISEYAGFVEGYFTNKVLDSNAVDYNGRPLSVPKWSLGGDVSYGWTLADYLVALLAVVVLGMSIAGLVWLMRSG